MNVLIKHFASQFLALGLLLTASLAWSQEKDCGYFFLRSDGGDSVLELGPNEVGIFGYGSLLNLESLERTLGHPYTGPIAVARLSGWQRDWSALYPNQNRFWADAPKSGSAPENLLYLNIQPNSEATTNGAIIVVKRTELARLDQRELTYDRKDITQQLKGVRVFGSKVYTYVAKDEFTARENIHFPRVGLRRTYFGIVDSALDRYGPQFREEFNQTTREAPQGTIFDDYADD